jgi:hypothetical protein
MATDPNALNAIQTLMKALEAGSANAAPGTLTQGSALQVEDLDTVMVNVTFQDKHLMLSKEIPVKPTKSLMVQFDRQLSYGQFGGSAQVEGAVGQEEDIDLVRVVVPMSFYSHLRRTTLVANMIDTVDGVKAEERQSEAAAKKIAADVEFDLFRGMADFSNAGAFDGNPLAIPQIPNLMGLEVHLRQSDLQSNSKDLMFAEFGSDDSIIVSAGGDTLTQSIIEDLSVRSAMNFGAADVLYIDPRALSQYNKISYGKERIVLAGAPQGASGADLRKQWTSSVPVDIKASRFLSAKTQPRRPRKGGPSAPTIALAAASSSTDLTAGDLKYKVSSCNEKGESLASAVSTVTITATQKVTVTITAPGDGSARYFNVYRSEVGGSTLMFIGRVANSGAATTAFVDLNNKVPGSITGFLLDKDGMEVKQLAPFTSAKLAQTDLSSVSAFFRFLTLVVKKPRLNVLCDNIATY